jgi:adenylate cyclase
MWRDFLGGRVEGLERMKGFFRRVPSAPRCKLCQAPFAGLGGRLLSLTPWRRWAANSALCSICTGSLGEMVGGAEVEATFLFADIRGSTGVAEHLRPAEYNAILQRFYKVCARAVDASGGLVDKFLGDGVVAFFVPVFTGDGGPAASGIRAGWAILDGVTEPDSAAWLPVGVGVHSGLTYMGVLGEEGGQLDFTGVGDAVNTAARLGCAAAAGELLVTLVTAARANFATDGLERRHLTLKGRDEPVDVVVLGRTEVAA